LEIHHIFSKESARFNCYNFTAVYFQIIFVVAVCKYASLSTASM